MINKTKKILDIIRLKNLPIIVPRISITATHSHSQLLCSDIYEQGISPDHLQILYPIDA
jgi:hypothetical protein